MTVVHGEVLFTSRNGQRAGPFPGAYHPDDHYVDVTKGGPGYPTRIDMRGNPITWINFTSHRRDQSHQWSTWSFFSHPGWLTDRFTELR